MALAVLGWTPFGGPSLVRAEGLFPSVQPLAAAGDTLVFAAEDRRHGSELWRSDGTVQGTRLLRDIRPGVKGSLSSALGDEARLAILEDAVYFPADDGRHGVELWRTDGTPEGTALVKDIRPGKRGSGLSLPFVVDQTLHFLADDGEHGTRLWRSDGMTDGTAMVVDLPIGLEGSEPWGQTVVGEKLCLTVPGPDLWCGDGTSLGTTLALESFGTLYGLAPVGENLIFVDERETAHDYETELWRTDGTVDGAFSLPVSDPGYDLVSSGPAVYLSAESDDQFWRSDGTAEGTSFVTAFSGGLDLQRATSVGETLYFPADDGQHGDELWRTDGTAAGTTLVQDIRRGPRTSSPRTVGALDETLYFGADDGEHGYELWRTDGSIGGTGLINDIWRGRRSSSPSFVASVGPTIYFMADDGRHGIELWGTDGTADGTRLVKDLRRGATDATWAYWPIIVGDQLYFSVLNDRCGGDLWRSDGSRDGTVRLMATARPAHQSPGGGCSIFPEYR